MGLRPVLRAVACRVLRLPPGHADVEDCVAETFRRMVEGRDRVRPGDPIAPWATGIARHVALDQLRARRRERVPAGQPAEVEVADPGPSPEERADGAKRLAALRAALTSLEEGPREAILAFHVEGLRYEEIAARLRVPMGTVATWIARGRKALAGAMTPGTKERT